jgi:hypothetical protein
VTPVPCRASWWRQIWIRGGARKEQESKNEGRNRSSSEEKQTTTTKNKTENGKRKEQRGGGEVGTDERKGNDGEGGREEGAYQGGRRSREGAMAMAMAKAKAKACLQEGRARRSQNCKRRENVIRL